MKTAVLILNPIAGRGTGSGLLAVLQADLERAGFSLEVVRPESPEEVRTLAASLEGSAELLIVGGGDGTVSQVVRGLRRRTTPIAILPLGTANVLAQELGIGLSPRKAIEVIVKGKPRPWNVGLANGERFLSFLGAGFDAQVALEVHRFRTGNIGYEHYLWPVLKTFAFLESPSITVEIDGKKFPRPVAQVVISNLRRYASFFELTQDIRPDDGLLDICLFSGKGRLNLARYMVSMFFRALPTLDDVTFLRGKRVVLSSEERVPYQVDGDPAGDLPVEVGLEREPLYLMVP